MREAGILLHITSLPGEYGVGTLGKWAYRFVDFLSTANQRYWQILPLGHTSYGDSPYATFSAFAGNPYMIDYDLLCEEGLLEKDEYQYLKKHFDKVDFGYLYNTKYDVLKIAYQKFEKNEAYETFVKNNKFWLTDYALFMSIKKEQENKCWLDWKEEYKTRNKKTLKEFTKEHLEDIQFWYFVQYIFYKQWFELKEYANSKNVKIIGDIPIYVAMDSSDVWSNVELFDISKDYVPNKVAGCPPDDFSKTGQLWGNPVYNWNKMEECEYDWWAKRMKHSLNIYDISRIDHFRGFEAYWAIPYGDETAENGKWIKGPNVKFFKALEEKLGTLNLIAEDLGTLTKSVHTMLKKLKYPGMRILEFGFDPKHDSLHAPHNVINNSVVYPSSHDLPTIRTWFNSLEHDEKYYVLDYLAAKDELYLVEEIVKCALATPANLAIVAYQDYLELPERGRMNTPNTLGNNWDYRVYDYEINDGLALKIAYWMKLYKRNEGK